MSDQVTQDLNATIASAVTARVEAEVLTALSSDAFLAEYVQAALQQQVVVPEDRNSHGKKRTEPYLTQVLRGAIQQATKSAVERLLVDEVERIEDEVRKHIRREAPALAEQLVGSLGAGAKSAYGVQVSLKMPGGY